EHAVAGLSGHTGAESERAYERLFSPEFRNRLDARLQFRQLSPEVMEQIVDKLLRELASQLTGKRVSIELTVPARKLLAERGYDPTYGARPLSRVLDQTVKRPLTHELLFGSLAKGGGTVVVDVEGGAIALRFEAAVRESGKKTGAGVPPTVADPQD
nr:ATP-dependent Clp protease ATP-binding subunit ClpA [Acidobacteriota bacterium]